MEHTTIFLLSMINMEDIRKFVKHVKEKVGFTEIVDVPTINIPYNI